MGIEADEVEPAQVVGQVLGGDAAERPQEAFDLLVAAVDGLDMEFAAHPLASGLNEGFVADAKGNGGRRETAGPSVTSRTSGPTAGSSTAWMAMAETAG